MRGRKEGHNSDATLCVSSSGFFLLPAALLRLTVGDWLSRDSLRADLRAVPAVGYERQYRPAAVRGPLLRATNRKLLQAGEQVGASSSSWRRRMTHFLQARRPKKAMGKNHSGQCLASS